MKTLERVLWSEGMFLAPQHLQQLDRYHEAVVSARLAAMSGASWGVTLCDLDMAALAGGLVAFERFEGVLPDGTPLSFDRGQSADSAPESRPVEGAFGSTQRTLEVFVGLRREREGTPSVAGEDLGAAQRGRTRFSVVRRKVSDVSASQSDEVEVPFAQKNVVILFGGEPRDDYDVIKVFEIERGPSGALRPVPTYVPPCPFIRASPFIMKGVDEVIATISARQRTLAGERRQREAGTVEFQGRDITRFLQLHTLNSFIPLLKHMVSAEQVATDQAFLILLQLAGELSTFSGDVDPATLPDFQYRDLTTCFGEIFAVLRNLLKVTVRSACFTVALENLGGKLVGRLSQEALNCTRFVLSVKSEMPSDQTARQVPLIAKIASTGEIDKLLKAATPGVRLSYAPDPPPEIPARPDAVYFSLTSADPNWNAVLRDRAIVICLPRPFNPGLAIVELFAIPASSQ